MGLHIFAGIMTGAIAIVLVAALVLMAIYAIDHAAFDKQLDEMKAKAIPMAQPTPANNTEEA